MTGPAHRVLFVDDDPQLLSGLSKALRKHRDRWAMVFVGSGEAALAEIGHGGFDVVVSDMRMPVMDGAALLARVREHDPTTIRMILSGFSDRTAIARAQPVAHQFFNKPCDLGELAAAIDRACGLRAMFASEPLRSLTGRLGVLPPAPARCHELAVQLGRAEVCVDDLTAMVERDPATYASVLRVAAEPVFGTGHRLGSIAEAASEVGIDVVAGLVLTSYAFGLAGARTAADLPLAELQLHSLQVARTARRLARSPGSGADALIAGLVHQIGKIVIATSFPDAHAAILRGCAEPGTAPCAVERSVLGTSHAEIGAYLLALWGLSLPVIDAVAHHHDDDVTAPGPVLAALRGAHAELAANPR
jgi:putative nucleotidyltransferase with HDIG domain